MQSIARLAGPVVHGFKRGSKLLGWCVATHVMSVTNHCNNATNVPALLQFALGSACVARSALHPHLNMLIALRPTANLGVTDAELEALAAGKQLSECSVESL